MASKCDPLISPDCPGHEGWEKLSDCLTGALYVADNDGETGDTDGFGLHIALFIQDMAETIDAAYDGVSVTIPAKTYCLIITAESGKVVRLDYDTAEGVQYAFDLYEKMYSGYLDEVDARELAITSSTGRIGR